MLNLDPFSKASLASIRMTTAASQKKFPVMEKATTLPVDRILMLHMMETVENPIKMENLVATRVITAETVLAAGRVTTVEMVQVEAEATNNSSHKKIPAIFAGIFLCFLAILIIITFATFTTLIITVTGQTGICSHGGGVTGSARGAPMIDAGAFLVNTRLRVSYIKTRGKPRSGVMAILTVHSKRPHMESRIFMAGYTLR